jgi:hypothetical protein
MSLGTKLQALPAEDHLEKPSLASENDVFDTTAA